MKKIIIKSNRQTGTGNRIEEAPAKIAKEQKRKKIREMISEGEDFLLEEKEGRFYTEKGRSFQVAFASDDSREEILTLSKGDQMIAMSYLRKITGKGKRTACKGKAEKNRMIYSEIEEGVDLEYRCREEGIKENLIIKKRQENYHFDFRLKIGDFEPAFNEEERTLELRKEGRPVFRILSPYMTDEAGERSDDCSYAVEQDGNELKLVLHCDEAWINDEERVFPVVVDPTIEVVGKKWLTMIPTTNSSASLSTDREAYFLGITENIVKGKLLAPIQFGIHLTIDCEALKEKINASDLNDIELSLRLKTCTLYDKAITFEIKNAVKTVTMSSANLQEIDLDLHAFWDETSDILELDFQPISKSTTVLYPTQGTVTYQYGLTLYSGNAGNSANRPTVIVTGEKRLKREKPTKKYRLNQQNETELSLIDGSYSHLHDPMIAIRQKALTVHLLQTYDGNDPENQRNFMGKGWRTNLHQTLTKSKDLNPIFGASSIVYRDGNGIEHLFRQTFSYVDENQKKHYVEKEDVFLDADYKLKYRSDPNTVYEIRHDVENEDHWTLIQGASINEYPGKARIRKKYFLNFGYGKREICVNEDIEHFHQFYYVRPGKDKKYYVLPSGVFKNPNGSFHTVNSVDDYLYLDNHADSMPLVEQGGKYGFVFKSTDSEEADTEVFCPLEEECIVEEYEYSDVYHNEELVNAESQILDMEAYIQELEITRQDLLQSIRICHEQLRLQGNLFTNQANMYQEQKELNQKYNRFYDTTGRDCEYTLIDSYGFTIDEEKLTFANVDSSDVRQAIDCLDAFTRLYKRMSEDMARTHGDTAHALEEMSTRATYGNLIETGARYESQFAETERKMENCRTQLEDLKSQRKALIDEQRKQVNDFILDEEGNTLGFDGYGRLIQIQDQYENKIEIEYGYEEENEGKMLSVYSDRQRIQFQYDEETGLVSSVTNPQGRRTKYVYDENGRLISIVGNDGRKSLFDYTDRFQYTSPMREGIEIAANEDGSYRVRTYCLNGTIKENTSLTGEEEQMLVSDEQYVFDREHGLQTTVSDLCRTSVVRYLFDEESHPVRRESDQGISVLFSNGNTHRLFVEYAQDAGLQVLGDKAENRTYEIDLTMWKQEGKLPVSNLLVLLFTADENALGRDISFHVEASVFYQVEGEERSENCRQTFETIRKDNYFPIFIDRKKSTRISVQVSGGDSAFTADVFDEIRLIAPENGVLYTYDEKKRLIKEQDGYTIKEYLDYDEKNHCHRIKETNIYGEEKMTQYAFDSFERLTYTEDSKGNVEEYDYDKKGNCIETRVYNRKGASLMKVEKATYDEYGNPVSSSGPIQDRDGSYPKEEITYLPGTNAESKVKGFKNETTHYRYDYHTGNVLSISSSSNGINNSTAFTYRYDRLTSMSHHGMKVNYEYDGRGRKTKISLNGEEVVWNTYTDHFDGSYTDPFNEDAEVSFQGTYANSTTSDGLFMESYRDEDGNLILNKYSSDDAFGAECYVYKDKDLVTEIRSQKTCRDTNETYRETLLTTYDEFDAVIRQEKKVNDLSEVITENRYDEDHRRIVSSDVILSREDYRLNAKNTYNEEHQLTTVNVREGIAGEEEEDAFLPVSETTLSYDALGRVIHQNVQANRIEICHEYSYLQQDENTLDLIAEDRMKVKVTEGSQITYLTETSTYGYDVNGNIVSVETDENRTRYDYDTLNRLIREDNPVLNKTIRYQYDKGGNLLSKKIYPYTVEETRTSPEVKEYIYDCEKRDRLIAYEGKEIAYDSMGRPTTYKDDEFEWNNQGQLLCVLRQNGDTIEYFYDTKGIRRKKIVNGAETTYITNGTQILAVKKGNERMIFRYVLNKLVGFRYNKGSQSKEYVYQRNIQGDIVSIFDDEGNQVGGYAYDAYGNTVITEDVDGLATLNPFRYSGFQIAGGISSTVSGGAAIYTGIGLLSFGPIGWISGGALILIGAGTMAFGVNEIVAGATGTNYIQSWTGMSDGLYNGLYIGLNIASVIGTTAGNMYMKYANVTGNKAGIKGKPFSRYSTIDDAGVKQYRFFDSKGNAWFDKDLRHGGANLKFPHYHGWINGIRLGGHWSFWDLIKWLF